jgi:hypothetical protein
MEDLCSECNLQTTIHQLQHRLNWMFKKIFYNHNCLPQNGTLTRHCIQEVQSIQNGTTGRRQYHENATTALSRQKTCTQLQESIAITLSCDTVVGQTDQRQTCTFLGQWPEHEPLPFNNSFMTSECLHFKHTNVAPQ